MEEGCSSVWTQRTKLTLEENKSETSPLCNERQGTITGSSGLIVMSHFRWSSAKLRTFNKQIFPLASRIAHFQDLQRVAVESTILIIAQLRHKTKPRDQTWNTSGAFLTFLLHYLSISSRENRSIITKDKSMWVLTQFTRPDRPVPLALPVRKSD